MSHMKVLIYSPLKHPKIEMKYSEYLETELNQTLCTDGEEDHVERMDKVFSFLNGKELNYLNKIRRGIIAEDCFLCANWGFSYGGWLEDLVEAYGKAVVEPKRFLDEVYNITVYLLSGEAEDGVSLDQQRLEKAKNKYREGIKERDRIEKEKEEKEDREYIEYLHDLPAKERDYHLRVFKDLKEREKENLERNQPPFHFFSIRCCATSAHWSKDPYNKLLPYYERTRSRPSSPYFKFSLISATLFSIAVLIDFNLFLHEAAFLFPIFLTILFLISYLSNKDVPMYNDSNIQLYLDEVHDRFEKNIKELNLKDLEDLKSIILGEKVIQEQSQFHSNKVYMSKNNRRLAHYLYGFLAKEDCRMHEWIGDHENILPAPSIRNIGIKDKCLKSVEARINEIKNAKNKDHLHKLEYTWAKLCFNDGCEELAKRSYLSDLKVLAVYE